MSATVGDLKRAAQVQSVRAQSVEEKAKRLGALNLLLNFGLARFHVALTSNGTVHSFELGFVRNPPGPDGVDLPSIPERATQSADRLSRKTFSQGHLYASAFHESEFRCSPGIRNGEVSSEIS